MPDGIKVHIDLKKFNAQWKRFEREMKRHIARSASKGAAVFANTVKQRAPVGTASPQRYAGLLRRSIRVAKSKRARKGSIEYGVIVARKRVARSAVKRLKARRRAAGRATDAFYWYFLEHGWAPRRPGQALRGGNRNKNLQRARNRAAGGRYIPASAHQFFAPAFGASKNAAFLAVQRELNKAIEIEARKG